MLIPRRHSCYFTAKLPACAGFPGPMHSNPNSQPEWPQVRREGTRSAVGAVRSLMFAAFLLAFASTPRAQDKPAPVPPSNGFSASDVAAAQQFGQTIGIVDWLGPLAPVALSPFFGIACLSGMAIFGGGWVSADNAFLGEASPLNNHAVFWTFLVLTLITSIPRLTKVSKPFAQAVDQVEAWAGIITLITLKVLMSATISDDGSTLPAEAPEMARLGIFSFTVDTLLVIAATMNIIVINTVKFFFEVVIWITPVPTIDAAFEVANKTACAGLMAIYGFSPTIATIINLAMLAVCLVVFRWVYRREVFFRTVLLDAVWSLISPSQAITQPEVVVFPVAGIGVFPARTRCVLQRNDDGWTLTQRRLLSRDIVMVFGDDCRAEVRAGYFTNCIRLTGTHTAELTFSRRYNHRLSDLAAALRAAIDAQDTAVVRDHGGLRTEMA